MLLEFAESQDFVKLVHQVVCKAGLATLTLNLPVKCSDQFSILE